MIDITKYEELLSKSFSKELGRVTKVVGLTIESAGPSAKLNDLCIITSKDGNQRVTAEVVGFNDNRILLMPFRSVVGIGIGATVENTGNPFQVYVGPELLGQVLDGLGQPLNGEALVLPETYPVEAEPPDPMKRKIISEILPLGVKAVDGLLTIGKGQRIGIFAANSPVRVGFSKSSAGMPDRIPATRN